MSFTSRINDLISGVTKKAEPIVKMAAKPGRGAKAAQLKKAGYPIGSFGKK